MRNNRPCKTRAFTLIELILVMALLVMAAALVTPQLSKFFGYRDLDSEVRRFVALTHYGQSRAVSEGIPMLLWIDTKAGTYGLQQETGYTDGDTKAQDFKVAEGLTIGADMAGVKPTGADKRVGIRFSPDGSVMNVGSVPAVFIQREKEPAVWIVQTPDRLSYEVQNQYTPLANARH